MFEVGEEAKVMSGKYDGDVGRIIGRLSRSKTMFYALVFPWDMKMFPIWFSEDELERV